MSKGHVLQKVINRFHCTESCQKAFQYVKLLHMMKANDKFRLESDTSKTQLMQLWINFSEVNDYLLFEEMVTTV